MTSQKPTILKGVPFEWYKKVKGACSSYFVKIYAQSFDKEFLSSSF